MSKSEYHKIRLGMDMIPLYARCNEFKNAQITMLRQSAKPFKRSLTIRVCVNNIPKAEMVFHGVRSFYVHMMPIEALDFRFYRFQRIFRFWHVNPIDMASRITAKKLEWRCIDDIIE